jgi:hypothetical protein
MQRYHSYSKHKTNNSNKHEQFFIVQIWKLLQKGEFFWNFYRANHTMMGAFTIRFFE